MATLAQMRTWVSKRLQDASNTAVSSSDVDEMINQAIKYWKNKRYFFNEITATTTLTQGNTSITLAPNWLVPSIDNCFVIEYNGIRYPLKKVSESRYNEMYLSNGVGQPDSFAKLANSGYHCYPIPDRDYTLHEYLVRDYDLLVNDGDENDFTTEAEFLTKYSAVAYGSRDFRQDLTMYDAFWVQAEKENNDLLETTRKDNATGSLELSSALIN